MSSPCAAHLKERCKQQQHNNKNNRNCTAPATIQRFKCTPWSIIACKNKKMHEINEPCTMNYHRLWTAFMMNSTEICVCLQSSAEAVRGAHLYSSLSPWYKHLPSIHKNIYRSICLSIEFTWSRLYYTNRSIQLKNTWCMMNYDED